MDEDHSTYCGHCTTKSGAGFTAWVYIIFSFMGMGINAAMIFLDLYFRVIRTIKYVAYWFVWCFHGAVTGIALMDIVYGHRLEKVENMNFDKVMRFWFLNCMIHEVLAAACTAVTFVLWMLEWNEHAKKCDQYKESTGLIWSVTYGILNGTILLFFKVYMLIQVYWFYREHKPPETESNQPAPAPSNRPAPAPSHQPAPAQSHQPAPAQTSQPAAAKTT